MTLRATSDSNKPVILILMGVSGVGKSTIGRLLAADLNWPFYDGDDFHPPQNVEKMSRGEALTDEDRLPWLDILSDLIRDHIQCGRSAIIACSALKDWYRERLQVDPDIVRFIYLKGEFETIRDRMEARKGHYFSPVLLRSQFDTLEEPDDCVAIAVDAPPEIVAGIIRKQLK